MEDHAAVKELSVEQQYVLYAAATSSSLMELRQHWQPWEPGLEWRDPAVQVPRLAQAIVELVEAGWVEVFLGLLGGESGLVPSADVPDVVHDSRNWYREDGRAPLVELVLTAAFEGQVRPPPPSPAWPISRQTDRTVQPSIQPSRPAGADTD
jgi:hypothetical protein